MSLFDQYFNSKTPSIEFAGTVHRIVESDLEVATSSITNNLAEQARLEELLEITKPHKKPSKKHHLFTTPFRYPPLKYGSRFGTTQMPSFFYASKDPITCLYECAHYRFLFLDDLEVPFKQPIQTNHLLFSCAIATPKALALTHHRYKPIHAQINHPSDHTLTQQIGAWALAEGYGVIEFQSARHFGGINHAVTAPEHIKSRKPKIIERLTCLSAPDRVLFHFNSQWLSIPPEVKDGPISNTK